MHSQKLCIALDLTRAARRSQCGARQVAGGGKRAATHAAASERSPFVDGRWPALSIDGPSSLQSRRLRLDAPLATDLTIVRDPAIASPVARLEFASPNRVGSQLRVRLTCSGFGGGEAVFNRNVAHGPLGATDFNIQDSAKYAAGAAARAVANRARQQAQKPKRQWHAGVAAGPNPNRLGAPGGGGREGSPAEGSRSRPGSRLWGSPASNAPPPIEIGPVSHANSAALPSACFLHPLMAASSAWPHRPGPGRRSDRLAASDFEPRLTSD